MGNRGNPMSQDLRYEIARIYWGLSDVTLSVFGMPGWRPIAEIAGKIQNDMSGRSAILGLVPVGYLGYYIYKKL